MWNVPHRQIVGSVYAAVIFTSLVSLGILVETKPLSSLRPAGEVAADGLASDKLIDARLWEDPLLAVMSAKHAASGAPQLETDSLLLAVFLSGRPYFEQREDHIRTRYAVLSALRSAGFKPQDSDHLRYFEAEVRVPFEEFIRDDSSEVKPTIRQVLVDWINEDRLTRQDGPPEDLKPLAALAKVLANHTLAESATRKVAIIGPTSSDRLLAMLREASDASKSGTDDSKNGDYAAIARATLYSTWSTIGPVALQQQLGAKSKSPVAILRAAPLEIEFQQSTATDDALVRQLIDELRLRGVDAATDAIALIAEWDTSYGRSLPMQFKQHVRQNAKLPEDSPLPNLHSYSYMRGLDGRRPGAGSQSAVKTPDDSHLEVPHGTAQGDYLVRLAEELRRVSRKYKAVGVLGSDVYDKLVILQALRPGLPGVVFFTTDLDARLTNANERAWTRNLIVASSYGLRLKQGLQPETAPFRSTYQTAVYYACRRATAPGDYCLPPAPESRVFEIARGEAYDLSVEKTDEVHPRGERRAAWTVTRLVLIVMLVSLGGLLVFCPLWWPAIQWWRTTSHSARAIALGAFGTLLVLYAIACFDHFRDGGEPLAWFREVSIWPTTFASLLTAWVAVAFCRVITSATQHSLKEIDCEFFNGANFPEETPEAEETPLMQEADRTASTRTCAQRLGNIVGVLRACFKAIPTGFKAIGRSIKAIPAGLKVFCEGACARWDRLPEAWTPIYVENNSYKSALWKKYLESSTLTRYRVASLFTLTVILGSLVYLTLGATAVPYRGWVSWLCYWIAILAAIAAVLVLSFLVFDITSRCTMMMNVLTSTVTWWTKKNIKEHLKKDPAHKNQELTPEDLARQGSEFLNIEFIATLTESVRTLVYYPFVAVVILAACHVNVFDNWHVSVPVIVTLSIPLTVVIIVGIMLRFSAERARRIAVANLSDFGDEANVAELIKRLEGLNRGAFGRWRTDPVVGAVLIPFVGGVATLAAYLLLPT